jgi:hypothetical protein
MRNLKFILGVFCLFTIASCSKSNRCDNFVCTDDCVFVEMSIVGNVHFYGCYNVWGVQFVTDEDEHIIGLALDMPMNLQVENSEVVFSASFYENDLPLALPDPMPGRFYKIEICEMNENLN